MNDGQARRLLEEAVAVLSSGAGVASMQRLAALVYEIDNTADFRDAYRMGTSQ